MSKNLDFSDGKIPKIESKEPTASLLSLSYKIGDEDEDSSEDEEIISDFEVDEQEEEHQLPLEDRSTAQRPHEVDNRALWAIQDLTSRMYQAAAAALDSATAPQLYQRWLNGRTATVYHLRRYPIEACAVLRLCANPNDPDSVTRFMRGIRIWEVLCRGDERRAILPLWGCGIAGAYSYTVSPLGYGDVGMYIDQNPGVDRLLLLIQMAECVKSLHDRNIVHGDLFETRFVVMEERYGVRVYLTGFYETEMLDTHGRVTCPWTVSDWNRLSWRAAPEMTAPGPCRVYGKPVDIWALGFLIMQLMTGRVPAHSTQYFMAHPDCLPSRPYGMTLRLYALVRACWSFRPAERPCIDQTITWLKQCRRQLLLDA